MGFASEESEVSQLFVVLIGNAREERSRGPGDPNTDY